MTPLNAKFAHFGFDYTRFRFGFRTGIAACLSLVIAWALGLEHPQWSAMTVWAVSQPTRGLLLEKAAYRTLGTLIGTVVGMVLVVTAGDNIIALALGLTVWVGLCVYVGNLLHGLISYGAILAGYSAAMVALLTRTPDALLPLGIDRLLTVFVGVITALFIGWLFTYKKAEQTLVNQFRRQTAENLKLLANAYQSGSLRQLNTHDRLSQLAHLEAQLIEHGTGSPAAHLSAKTIRRVLNAQMGLFAQLEAKGIIQSQKISEHLHSCSEALVKNQTKSIRYNLKQSLKVFNHQPMTSYFREFVEASLARLEFRDTGTTARSVRGVSVLLHRDWRGARQAAIRTIIAMTIISVVWGYTGWFQMAYLLLGASVMLTLFSTGENPAKTMYYVFLGQTAGAITALAMQALIWPYADSILLMLVYLMPIILLAAFPMSHNRTAPGAMDFNFVFLLLMQPALQYQFEPIQAITIALAVIAAPLVAMVSYRLVFPTNLRSRQQQLIISLERDLNELQRHQLSGTKLTRYRARLYHRLFKLFLMADKLGVDAKVTATHYLFRVQHQVNQHE
ncbi:MAG: FUSC family protein [Pseudomonadota bacterium]